MHECIGVFCVLDGEIVSFREGVDHLESLQMRLNDKKARRQSEYPVDVRFFDCLECTGTDITGRSLEDRRAILHECLSTTGFPMPEVLPQGTADCDIPTHWEGVICKRLSAAYECGKRRKTWSKWKFVQRTTLRVSGLTPGKGARASSFGAVEVADEDGHPRGQVGSGFPKTVIADIMRREADGSLIGALVEVEYRFLSKSGLMVNTAFKGFRNDKLEADRLMGDRLG